MKFKPVDPKADFVRSEEEVLAFWDKEKMFAKSLEQRRDARRFVFFEGPPTANAKPGLHHALARYFKDLFPRYKTMRGFLVERKAGWDTHGLPVEIAVEKELGLKSKPEIEKYGVAKFNAKARESAWEYKADWEKFTKRSGFWLDMEHPYITYEPDYIESVWWILKQAWGKDMIYRGHRVVPRCPRCGTALSSHEVAQGYKEVTESSVYFKFKIKNEELKNKYGEELYVLAWTTTPWTLPGNVALAVNPDIEYAIVQPQGLDEKFIVARPDALLNRIFEGKSVDILTKMRGKDLVGMEYEPLFPGAVPSDTPNFTNAFKVYPADFVTTEDGTGVVHTAVMYGEDDYQLGERVGLPKFHTVLPDGKFGPTVKKWAGQFVKDHKVERGIIADLEKRGLLFKEMPFTHDYPFCWRCETPLIYYAAESWFIAMSKLRNQLIKNNQGVNWIPSHIKDGRFGEWLREVKDWGISRERYWGTPLPFWMPVRAANGEAVVGGNDSPAGEGEILCVG